MRLKDKWYSDITYFLTYGECLDHVKGKDQKSLQLKAAKFVIVYDILYKRGLDGMFLKCVDTNQEEKLLGNFHSEACKGNFSSIVTAFKILRSGYYWLGMFKFSYKWVDDCEKCKLCMSKLQLVSLPLKPIVIEEPFQQWGLDFIGQSIPTPALDRLSQLIII